MWAVSLSPLWSTPSHPAPPPGMVSAEPPTKESAETGGGDRGEQKQDADDRQELEKESRVSWCEVGEMTTRLPGGRPDFRGRVQPPSLA